MPSTASDMNLVDGRRQHARLSICAAAELRPRTLRKISIKVFDISVAGFRITTISPLHIGEDVYLHLPGIAPLKGTLRWKSGMQYGGEFSHPLHPSVAEHLASRLK